MYLTKTKYVRGMQCPKMVWMGEHMSELAVSCALQSTLDTGNAVGDLARRYFGDYSLVPFEEPKKMQEETLRLMEQGVENIAEATFVYQNLLCRVDILHFNGQGYDLVEVKSSTKQNDAHVHDVSFQYYVLTKAGIQVDNVYLLHINNEYSRKGDLDLGELFTKVDLTAEAESRICEVEQNVKALLSLVNMENEPDQELDIYCVEPYECDFRGHCFRNLPSPSVMDFPGMGRKTKFKYYREGIIRYEDFNNNLSKLTTRQKKCFQVEVTNAPDVIEKSEIKKFIGSLSYPIYYLDFETFKAAIPLYDGTKPYQQIPFQYSLHVQDEKNGPVIHREFLGKEGADPRRALAEQLCKEIPMNACTLAYNMRFEKGRLKELAAAFEDLSEHLMNIHDNMYDLMVPFQKQHYYSRKLKGSYSIKYVLPTMCPGDPELDYTALDEIHNGTEAMDAFPRMSSGKMSSEEIEKTRKNLLAYCRLDTLAMVKILDKLQELVE